MNHEYWKTFWRNHAHATTGAPAQCQVLRTLNKQPLDDDGFAKILRNIEGSLHLSDEDSLLDLCCGNGAITTFLASKCKSVVGIDYAVDLLTQVDTSSHPNVALRSEDVNTAVLGEAAFTKVLLYAGIQYFSEAQTVGLVCQVERSLRAGGLFLLGDVPDLRRIWNFYDSAERERAYFDSLKAEKPIVGAWFDAGWLSKLGAYAGFADVRVIPQPSDFPYSHYRFDVLMKKV